MLMDPKRRKRETFLTGLQTLGVYVVLTAISAFCWWALFVAVSQ
jgi:cytoskeletal protein RodZ